MRKAWFWWVAIAIWVVLLFLIKRSFEFGGNPIVFFLIMMVVFFLVLFVLRVAIIRARGWWASLKRRFAFLNRPR